MTEATDSDLRIDHLPPYLLGSIAGAVIDARNAGQDIVDLSQINPDLGPPPVALERLVQAALLSHNHRYSSSQGVGKLRQAICGWYQSKYGVEFDPQREVVATLGTKEGLSHFLLAVAKPGETVLVPTPAYPIHSSAVFIAGCSFIGAPLFEEISRQGESRILGEDEEAFFTNLAGRFSASWPRPRIMIVSFPHNPTTAVVNLGFFERLINFARRHNLIVVHDFAYADLVFDGYRAPSIFEVPRAREVAVEFFSLSKSFSLPGWRVGSCVGNERLVSALKKIKSYLDFGIFQPLQIAAVSVFAQHREITPEIVETYRSRRDVFIGELSTAGWPIERPKATAFVWARIPGSLAEQGSVSFCHKLLSEAGVAACPGAGFDRDADPFVRFALVENERRLRLAAARIASVISGHGGQLG